MNSIGVGPWDNEEPAGSNSVDDEIAVLPEAHVLTKNKEGPFLANGTDEESFVPPQKDSAPEILRDQEKSEEEEDPAPLGVAEDPAIEVLGMEEEKEEQKEKEPPEEKISQSSEHRDPGSAKPNSNSSTSTALETPVTVPRKQKVQQRWKRDANHLPAKAYYQ